MRAWPVLLLLSGCGGRDLTVRALSEYGRSPIAGVLLQADDGEWVFTDDQGEAVLEGVGASFTVRVHQHVIGQFSGPPSSGWANDDVWELQSPEGDPLVLLVEGSFVPRNYATVSGFLSGTSGGPIRVFASNDTSDRMPYSLQGAGTQFDVGVQWEGLGPLDTTFRAFETDNTQLPEHYVAYGEYSARLETGASLTDFTIPLQPVNEATVTAAPTVPSGMGANVQLELSASLRVEGGEGLIWLGSITSGPSLSAVFPQVSGTVPWMGITARDMSAFDGAQSWDRHVVSPPETGVLFDLPAPVALVDPEEGATLNQDTVFKWRDGPAAGGRSTFHMLCNWSDAAGVLRQVNYRTVEGSGTEARLPAIPNIDLAGASCRWSAGWAPAGTHEGALLPERGAGEYRGSRSQGRSAVFK